MGHGSRWQPETKRRGCEDVDRLWKTDSGLPSLFLYRESVGPVSQRSRSLYISARSLTSILPPLLALGNNDSALPGPP